MQKPTGDPERAARLRLARELAGYSSSNEAARALHLTTSTYTHHENAWRNFPVATGRRYAVFFGVSFDWLMFGEGPMKPGSQPELLAMFQQMSEEHREKWLQAQKLLLEIIVDLIHKIQPPWSDD